MIHDMISSSVFMSGAGMSFLGPDQRKDLGCVTTRHPLELGLGVIPRVDRDATLGSTEGMPAIAHFHVIHIARALTSSRSTSRVIADPALRGAAGHVVVNAVALINARRAVVHAERNRDDQRALGARRISWTPGPGP